MEMVQSRHIIQTLDRLISEMNILRSEIRWVNLDSTVNIVLGFSG